MKVFLLFFLFQIAYAEEFVCDDFPKITQKEYTPQEKPSYWITITPDGSTVSYMADVGNVIEDITPTSIGATMQAPGKVDIQYAPDQFFMTIVNKHPANEKSSWGVEHGTSWYLTQDLLDYFDRTKNRNGAVVDASQFPSAARAIPRDAIDREFFNHYHSMGIFSDSNNQSWIRVLNDLTGASMRDYQFSGKEMVNKGPITHLTSDGDAVDKYGNSYIDLPMMSRDGKIFSGYNRKTMTSQLFSIEPDPNIPGAYHRRYLADLGVETGKIAFAYRQPQSVYLDLAFHVDYVVREEGNKMSGDMSGQSKDILIVRMREGTGSHGEYTLDKVAYSVLTHTTKLGEGNYYPQMSKNGDLVYVQVSNNHTYSPQYKFIKIAMDQLTFIPFNLPQKLSPEDETCGRTRFNALVALGGMWSQKCTNFAEHLTASNAAVKALGLTNQQCFALSKEWETNRSKILSMQDLYFLHTPHSRAGHARPEGRWTVKGEDRREWTADPKLIAALTPDALGKACQEYNQNYRNLCGGLD